MRFLFLCFVFAIPNLNYKIEAERIDISKEEDLELERQLKILNKPPIKSFQNKDGRIIDCIEINKQPAFDHPLLKNHTIQLQPSSLPKGMQIKKSVSLAPNRHQGANCSPGTVPIPRTTKEDLIRAKTLSSLYHAKVDSLTGSTNSPPGHYFAVVGTRVNEKENYCGVTADISIYNETVSPTQHSGAGLWLANRLNGHSEGIHYGWTVNPNLYGDSLTRTVSFWTVDNNRGCFNFLCPGFVQVDPKYHVGVPITGQSVYGGNQYALMPLIYKDPKTKNWWIIEKDRNAGKIAIGYWPSSLFTRLATSATEVLFGGEVFSPPNEPPPAMGSGHFEPPNFSHTSFVAQIQLVNAKNEYFVPEKIAMNTLIDLPKCHRAKYLGKAGGRYGYAMMFGGPGGTLCN